MGIDIKVARGVLTRLLLISFIGLCLWAYSRKRESAFNEAANLPFADEDQSTRSGAHSGVSPANSRKNGEPS